MGDNLLKSIEAEEELSSGKQKPQEFEHLSSELTEVDLLNLVPKTKNENKSQPEYMKSEGNKTYEKPIVISSKTIDKSGEKELKQVCPETSNSRKKSNEKNEHLLSEEYNQIYSAPKRKDDILFKPLSLDMKANTSDNNYEAVGNDPRDEKCSKDKPDVCFMYEKNYQKENL